MQTSQGSLTIVNAHTETPNIFWNGIKIDGVIRLHVHNDEEDHRVKLVVSGNQDLIYAEMAEVGIAIKKVTQ